jgi:hypothetical protein
MEKVAVVILVLIFLALIFFFIFSQGGPSDMINGVISFLNSTTEVVTKK